jgi:hypothetical protein
LHAPARALGGALGGGNLLAKGGLCSLCGVELGSSRFASLKQDRKAGASGGLRPGGDRRNELLRTCGRPVVDFALGFHKPGSSRCDNGSGAVNSGAGFVDMPVGGRGRLDGLRQRFARWG